ncbi:EF-hand domain pair [Pycnococcus provasolii]
MGCKSSRVVPQSGAPNSSFTPAWAKYDPEKELSRQKLANEVRQKTYAEMYGAIDNLKRRGDLYEANLLKRIVEDAERKLTPRNYNTPLPLNGYSRGASTWGAQDVAQEKELMADLPVAMPSQVTPAASAPNKPKPTPKQEKRPAWAESPEPDELLKDFEKEQDMREKESAVKIQTVYRGYEARREVQKMRAEAEVRRYLESVDQPKSSAPVPPIRSLEPQVRTNRFPAASGAASGAASARGSARMERIEFNAASAYERDQFMYASAKKHNNDPVTAKRALQLSNDLEAAATNMDAMAAEGHAMLVRMAQEQQTQDKRREIEAEEAAAAAEAEAARLIQARVRGAKAREQVQAMREEAQRQKEAAEAAEAEAARLIQARVRGAKAREQVQAIREEAQREMDAAEAAEAEAARLIQARVRGAKAREQVQAMREEAQREMEAAEIIEGDEAEEAAALMIQAHVRGAKAREQVEAMREEAQREMEAAELAEAAVEEEAARLIQARVRGAKAREQVQVMREEISQKAAETADEVDVNEAKELRLDELQKEVKYTESAAQEEEQEAIALRNEFDELQQDIMAVGSPRPEAMAETRNHSSLSYRRSQILPSDALDGLDLPGLDDDEDNDAVALPPAAEEEGEEQGSAELLRKMSSATEAVEEAIASAIDAAQVETPRVSEVAVAPPTEDTEVAEVPQPSESAEDLQQQADTEGADEVLEMLLSEVVDSSGRESKDPDAEIEIIQRELDDEMSKVMEAEVGSLSEEEVQAAKNLFEDADADNSGALDIKELHVVLERLGIHIDPATVFVYVQMLLKDFDANDDEKLEWDEFIIFYEKSLRTEAVRARYARKVTKMMEAAHMEESKRLFEKYDADQNGFIDLEELESLLKESLSLNMEEEKFKHFVADVFQKADTDNSGTIDEEEFVNLFRECLANEDVVREYEERVRIRYSNGQWTAR